MRTYINIFIVFLISGFWHGANWTFILWGILHGLLSILTRIFAKPYNTLPKWVRWALTFGMVSVLWLLFRCNSIQQWHYFLHKMLQVSDIALSTSLLDMFVIKELG